MTADEQVEALAEVLRGWYLESVGQISHNDALSIARGILASPAFRALVAGERAAALRKAADEIGEGDGISRFIGMESVTSAVRAEKRAQQWLRERADRETP